MTLPNIPLDLNLLPGLDGVYLVGGTARDLLLDKVPVDYDIAVSQSPEIFAEMTAARAQGRLVRMGRPGKRSYRVVAGETILDITGLNGPTIRHDLEGRDVTINAMAVELAAGRVLDWVGGRRDLAEKRIRMVSNTAFRADPVRLLRVFRLAAALNYSIEGRTLSTIERDASLIRLSAGERIRSELYQLFSCRNSAPHVGTMVETALLQAIFPELSPVPPPAGTVAHDAIRQSHLLPAYKHLEDLLNNLPPGFSPADKRSDSPTQPDHGAWLKLAVILTRQYRALDSRAAAQLDGETSLSGHEKTMANAIEATCRRLRLSTKERLFVTGIVANHTRPFHLYNAFKKEKLTQKAVTRFFISVDTLVPHLLLLALAEAQAGPTDPTSFSDFTRHMLRAYYETYLPVKARPPFVSGRDLVTDFGLPPSPLFKRILTRLEEARLSGETAHRPSALKMADSMIREFKP